MHDNVNLLHAYQYRLGTPRTRYGWAAEASSSPAFRYWVETVWEHRLDDAQATWSAWLVGALCIHAHEGAWTDNTGNGYTGGLQYLDSTWLAHGGGRFAPRAYQASPLDQLIIARWTWVADHGSWHEWGTADECGLS